MNSKGWIKIHRKLRENPIYSKSNYIAIWIYLLMEANFKEKRIIWNRKPFTVEKGAMITSISKIATHFNLSTGTVSYILNYLEVEKMIEKRSTMKFTYIKVINYDKYQRVEKRIENKVKTKEKQSENKVKHKKNYKNVKNDKNIYLDVLDFWNSKNIIQHQLKGNVGEKIKKAINGRLNEGYKQEDITKAVENYSEVLNSDKHFFSYKWSFYEFLTRGFENFKEEADPLFNYLKRKDQKTKNFDTENTSRFNQF